MAKTIVLTELRIVGMYVDIINQKVTVNYSFHDAGGRKWDNSYQETYWVTMPANPTAQDVQLPVQYLQNLIDLYTAAKNALTSKYLI
jgi:hypothetical protein